VRQVQQIGMVEVRGSFRSIEQHPLFDRNDHPFVPTCLPAERRAQRQSRMPSRMRRHRRSRQRSVLDRASTVAYG